jgi:sensor histidine kinase regulating citrate/malate metabolism
MQLRLRTKLTLVMTGLVLLVVAAVSGVYFALLLQQVLDQSERRATEIAKSTFDQVNAALQDAKAQGWLPESNAPEDIRDYVAYALGASQGLQAQLQAAIASPSIISEISITDRDGRVLASSDKS